MKTARINYVGSHDVSIYPPFFLHLLCFSKLFSMMQMEYTEIRPIRPNQSVVLAGLGVQGKGVGRCRKDRCQHHFCLQYEPDVFGAQIFFDSQILFGVKIIIIITIIVITKGKHSCHPLHARGYRSTQGAGYSDGLVIHTSRPTTMQVNFGLTDGRK